MQLHGIYMFFLVILPYHIQSYYIPFLALSNQLTLYCSIPFYSILSGVRHFYGQREEERVQQQQSLSQSLEVSTEELQHGLNWPDLSWLKDALDTRWQCCMQHTVIHHVTTNAMQYNTVHRITPYYITSHHIKSYHIACEDINLNRAISHHITPHDTILHYTTL